LGKDREWIKTLLERAKQAVGVEDNIKLVLYPMKYKVASISLKNKSIRLNKNLLELFDEYELYYILVHELIHIKHSTLNHGEEFYKALYNLFSLEEADEIESRIVKKLINSININMRAKRWLT
jgi:predicted metal-dependent hydrolase